MSHTLPLTEPEYAALPPQCYARVDTERLPDAHWVAVNRPLAAALGLPDDIFEREGTLDALSGNLAHYPVRPLASVYSGHQFGVYVPQLGDGRAVLLGESRDSDGNIMEWQLKGAGRTPFSRFADGRAVLRSSIREYLCSEAVHALGIPTTRALALAGSSEPVFREKQETAAVVTRIAPSFLRFGHFEYFHHRKQHDTVRALAAFLIRRGYPECAEADNPYTALAAAAASRSAALVAQWQCAGFCHGVLNTDNMSALGLTVDYGPFGFLDAYDRRHVCNHSDDLGRYAYNRQPDIVQWNLARFVSCFLPFSPEADLVAVLDNFVGQFQTAYEEGMRAKLGLYTAQPDDSGLIADLFAVLQGRNVDFTLFFRRLSQLDSTHGSPLPPPLAALFGSDAAALDLWLGRYRRRLRMEALPEGERRRRMDAVNPLYTLRNHLLQQAIALAEQGDFRETDRLQRCMADPYTERAEFADFAGPAPEWAAQICVSCSS